ncbi:MAG: SulP family inorganic anion transporter [Pseudomonadota bacterium]
MFSNLKSDLPASIVVFFVAVPLCLGIALASGAPLISGLIAGIVGGIVVGSLSGSQVGVSGPAAGLAAIVLAGITQVGGYENFLVCVVLAGFIQLGLGVLKAGVIGYYFPSSVIKGMLTGIGIIIVLKQIPHFFGYDTDPEGDFAFFQVDGENTFSALFSTIDNISLGATLIACLAMAILLLWEMVLTKRARVFQLIQGPLVAVVAGIVYFLVTRGSEGLGISAEHLVNVPITSNVTELLAFPDFSAISQASVWIMAVTIAVVASLETLLCVEATDKLDDQKRVTPTTRELLAQGAGNVLSGCIGGLPVTQVIVRSSANIQSGAATKLSAILHGVLLLVFVLVVPGLLNMIPLSVLAAILFVVGYKLAKPSLFKQMYSLGWTQFVPFIVTVLGIVFTDLLLGIFMGLAVSVVVILRESFKNSHFLHREEENGEIKMTLAEEVTFFNKAAILLELDELEAGSSVVLDVRSTRFLDQDVVEILDDFAEKARQRNINIKVVAEGHTAENPESYREFFRLAW